ncbi:transmembrane protein, putative (macronuclear) [Tetrahymena thermophila SB210]|uniref:Transmembrane protein, putative n=1 Tax=Tetrahymena thermophila (strain SB210) TaxID=312017 RepID=W7X1C5_TETTS|nr:transmembrane protein, putative [Tetrahymena thermophila SB210]EWS71387.1 transmembrane protein, putative [Tetrahymena thermophila SB210]|eukprot:XP_012656088.1 transmembrane protein, putative [Tetrahymena thermophila SB210]
MNNFPLQFFIRSTLYYLQNLLIIFNLQIKYIIIFLCQLPLQLFIYWFIIFNELIKSFLKKTQSKIILINQFKITILIFGSNKTQIEKIKLQFLKSVIFFYLFLCQNNISKFLKQLIFCYLTLLLTDQMIQFKLFEKNFQIKRQNKNIKQKIDKIILTYLVIGILMKIQFYFLIKFLFILNQKKIVQNFKLFLIFIRKIANLLILQLNKIQIIQRQIKGYVDNYLRHKLNMFSNKEIKKFSVNDQFFQKEIQIMQLNILLLFKIGVFQIMLVEKINILNTLASFIYFGQQVSPQILTENQNGQLVCSFFFFNLNDQKEFKQLKCINYTLL